MNMPASIAALADRLDRDSEIVPDPELFSSPEVLAFERQRIFVRPAVPVDHASRLAGESRYFRADAAGRPILVTRDGEGRLHALRNVCLHAGYPVCDAEGGAGERLVCPYHGWEYAPDGRLVEPDLSARIDPARLRLQRYKVGVRVGLIFVDLSASSELPSEAGSGLPPWLAAASVSRRARWSTSWNWKFTLRFLKSSPQLFLADAAAPDGWCSLGPLSLILLQSDRAALLNLVPKYAGRTDFQLVEMAAPGAATPDASAADGIGEALDRAAESGLPPLDRAFFDWYWSLLSTP